MRGWDCVFLRVYAMRCGLCSSGMDGLVTPRRPHESGRKQASVSAKPGVASLHASRPERVGKRPWCLATDHKIGPRTPTHGFLLHSRRV